jgi:hypothetical protein
MTYTVATTEVVTTLNGQIQVRNTNDCVVGSHESLMAAFETPLHLLRDGATIEREGRILATFFACEEKSGMWRVWVYGGLK